MYMYVCMCIPQSKWSDLIDGVPTPLYACVITIVYLMCLNAFDESLLTPS